jgi:hypothetical protein
MTPLYLPDWCSVSLVTLEARFGPAPQLEWRPTHPTANKEAPQNIEYNVENGLGGDIDRRTSPRGSGSQRGCLDGFGS